MKEKEFNLSEERNLSNGFVWYKESKVKEAVKILKEEMCDKCNLDVNGQGVCDVCKEDLELIDKIFGDKLI